MIDSKESKNIKPSSPTLISIWNTGMIWFTAGIAVWLILLIFGSPRLPSGDLVGFKDAGVNFAQGKGLVEIANPGNPTLIPKFYSTYPPLYPTIYGLYVSQAGVTPRADGIFDFILSALAAVMFWFFVTDRHTDRRAKTPSLILLGLLVVMLPIGPFWTQRERPDSLGFIVMMMSLWVLRTHLTPKRICLATFIAGIGSLISPFTFVMNGIAIGCLILVDIGQPNLSPGLRLNKLLRYLAVACAGVTPPVASLLLIQWINDPEAAARFIAHAMGKTTGGQAGVGYLASLLAGDFKTYFGAFHRYDSFRYKWMLAHLVFVTAATTIFLIHSNHKKSSSRSCWQALALLALAAVPLIAFPYQPCYMSLTATMVIILFSMLDRMEPVQESPNCHWVPVAGVGFIALVAVPFMLRDFLIGFQARETYQKATATIGRLRCDPNQKIQLVAGTATSYLLFKEAGFEIVEAAYLQQPSDFAKVDLFAFYTGGESQEGARRFPDWWKADEMETVHLASKSPDLKLFGRTIPDISLFGINIYHSSATWEPDLYRYKIKFNPSPEYSSPAQLR